MDIAKNVLIIAASTICAVGGAGAIVALIVKFCAHKIADALEKKYQQKLDMNLAKYKTSLDSKLYITKTKYDLEIDTYKTLLKSFYKVVLYSNTLITPGLASKLSDKTAQDEKDKKNYAKLEKTVLVAQELLLSNTAFIPDNIYSLFSTIHKKGMEQLHAFGKRYNLSFGYNRNLSTEDYTRSSSMVDDLKNINTAIRDRIDKLIIV